MNTYFFDTYALFEIVEGNENYRRFSKEVVIITTKMNLYELHYRLLQEFGYKFANTIFDKFSDRCINISDEDIKKASEMKHKLKKLKMSYVDALGYAISMTRGIKFLTGDNAFKDLSGVEFVK